MSIKYYVIAHGIVEIHKYSNFPSLFKISLCDISELRMLPAVLHCEMHAFMNPTKPCSNAIDRIASRLSVCNTFIQCQSVSADNVTEATHETWLLHQHTIPMYALTAIE